MRPSYLPIAWWDRLRPWPTSCGMLPNGVHFALSDGVAWADAHASCFRAPGVPYRIAARRGQGPWAWWIGLMT